MIHCKFYIIPRGLYLFSDSGIVSMRVQKRPNGRDSGQEIFFNQTMRVKEIRYIYKAENKIVFVVADGIAASKTKVAHEIDKGLAEYVTVSTDGVKSAPVHVVHAELTQEPYLRTDGNETTEDNLGELPTFDPSVPPYVIHLLVEATEHRTLHIPLT